MAESSVQVSRCKRCGTKIRNQRAICPSCGFDLKAPAVQSEESAPAAAPTGPRKVAAKAGVKMCQICMASVPEDQTIDHEGQRICPNCAENLKQKAARKAAGGDKK